MVYIARPAHKLKTHVLPAPDSPTRTGTLESE